MFAITITITNNITNYNTALDDSEPSLNGLSIAFWGRKKTLLIVEIDI